MMPRRKQIYPKQVKDDVTSSHSATTNDQGNIQHSNIEGCSNEPQETVTSCHSILTTTTTTPPSEPIADGSGDNMDTLSDEPLDLSVKGRPHSSYQSYLFDGTNGVSTLESLERRFGSSAILEHVSPNPMKIAANLPVDNDSYTAKYIMKGMKSYFFNPAPPLIHYPNPPPGGSSSRYRKTSQNREIARFSCKCGEAYHSLYDLSAHIKKTGHEPANHKLDVGHGEYPKLVRGQDLWMHQGVQQAEKILCCMVCGDSFKTLPEFAVHMMETGHHSTLDEKKTIQDYISYFKDDSTLPPFFMCKECHGMFSDIQELGLHMADTNHHKTNMARNRSLARSRPLSGKLFNQQKGRTECKMAVMSHDISMETKQTTGSKTTKIVCENCSQKIRTDLIVSHLRFDCISPNSSENIPQKLPRQLTPCDHESIQSRDQSESSQKEAMYLVPDDDDEPGGSALKAMESFMEKFREPEISVSRRYEESIMKADYDIREESKFKYGMDQHFNGATYNGRLRVHINDSAENGIILPSKTQCTSNLELSPEPQNQSPGQGQEIIDPANTLQTINSCNILKSLRGLVDSQCDGVQNQRSDGNPLGSLREMTSQTKPVNEFKPSVMHPSNWHGWSSVERSPLSHQPPTKNGTLASSSSGGCCKHRHDIEDDTSPRTKPPKDDSNVESVYCDISDNEVLRANDYHDIVMSRSNDVSMSNKTVQLSTYKERPKRRIGTSHSSCSTLPKKSCDQCCQSTKFAKYFNMAREKLANLS